MFSAYLWGIETSYIRIGPFLSSGFQPTYEELKLSDTTIQVGLNWGFQPTYEELKLFFYELDLSFNFVFSLPMRNWNRECIPWRRLAVDKFSAYLWGIETLKQLVKYVEKERFSAYLWGIETRRGLRKTSWLGAFSAYLWGIETHSGTHYQGRCGSFQPTYEELKQSKLTFGKWWYLVFSLPMRNWNTACGITSGCAGCCFQPTYEELKPALGHIPQRPRECFQPTYEELKR